MKLQGILTFIEMGAIGLLLFPHFPAMAEEGALADSARPVQPERSLASKPDSSLNPLDNGRGRFGHDRVPPFKTATRGRTIQSAREAQALQFHQNTLLSRFQNADAHGQIFLTFSENRMDLTLRSITGAEAPIAGVSLPLQK